MVNNKTLIIVILSAAVISAGIVVFVKHRGIDVSSVSTERPVVSTGPAETIELAPPTAGITTSSTDALASETSVSSETTCEETTCEETTDPTDPNIRETGDYKTLETAVTNLPGNKVTENEFITREDGGTQAYPIAHRDFEKIPDMNASWDLNELVEKENWLCGTLERLEGSNIVVLKDENNQEFKVHLIGINWLSDDAVTITANTVEPILYASVTSQYDTVYVEPGNSFMNADGSYNGYVWTFYNASDSTLSQLNELLLIEGLAEPALDSINTKYNNWYIQYPALYF